MYIIIFEEYLTRKVHYNDFRVFREEGGDDGSGSPMELCYKVLWETLLLVQVF